MVWRTGTRRCCAQASPQGSEGARCGRCIRKGITSGRGTGGPYAVQSRRPSWCGWWSSGGYSGGCMQQGSYRTTCGGLCRAGPQGKQAFCMTNICQTGGGYENLINPGGAISKAIRVSRVFSGSWVGPTEMCLPEGVGLLWLSALSTANGCHVAVLWLTKQLKSPPSKTAGYFCSNGRMAASTLRLHASPAGAYMDATKKGCAPGRVRRAAVTIRCLTGLTQGVTNWLKRGENTKQDPCAHLGFYEVQKSQNQLRCELNFKLHLMMQFSMNMNHFHSLKRKNSVAALKQPFQTPMCSFNASIPRKFDFGRSN